MADISTVYMGMKLSSPIIVSSSGLSKSPEQIVNAAGYGAGAVVMKSLFEEQIRHDAGKAITDTHNHYPEAEDYINNYSRHNSVSEYIEHIKNIKREVSIPVIASINCISHKEWMGFAKDIEQAGANGLELNMYIIPKDINQAPGVVEQKYFEIIETLLKNISIPVAIKIGTYFSNLPWFVNQMKIRGINTFVLFNRFYEPDINIDTLQMVSSSVFSKESDIRGNLRWIGMINGLVKDVELSASTGIHDGAAVIKEILAGAQTVQVCSVLYKKGMKVIESMIDEMQEWMDDHKYTSLSNFRGKLSYSNITDPETYERAQFIKYFSSLE
ncbi:MAG TPA: dihydroorotate dehydrogenase-like protein [Bacteroidales bacterium]|nr:dihydroorotate dehydrogenase-like protein [Bacteroidales bacterium]